MAITHFTNSYSFEKTLHPVNVKNFTPSNEDKDFEKLLILLKSIKKMKKKEKNSKIKHIIQKEMWTFTSVSKKLWSDSFLIEVTV